jgi:hypothetical protein
MVRRVAGLDYGWLVVLLLETSVLRQPGVCQEREPTSHSSRQCRSTSSLAFCVPSMATFSWRFRAAGRGWSVTMLGKTD